MVSSALAPLSLRFYGTEREWSRTGEGQEEDCRGTREEQEEERVHNGVHNGTDPIVHCVKGDFYPKQEESIPIPIAAEE